MSVSPSPRAAARTTGASSSSWSRPSGVPAGSGFLAGLGFVAGRVLQVLAVVRAALGRRLKLREPRVGATDIIGPVMRACRRAVGIGHAGDHGRGQDARAEGRVLVIAQLGGADRRLAGDKHQRVACGELHHLAGGQQRARGLLPADHDVREPRREAMPGIVAHRTLLGRGAERVRQTLGGALVVGRERDPDVAVVEDRIVVAIHLLDLVEALSDQESADAVAGDEREAGLEKVEAAERRELIEHHQHAAAL